MKQISLILLIINCIVGCKEDEISNNISSVNNLKIYDMEVQRVKKTHHLFGFINPSKILFVDQDGNRVFDFSNEEFINNETVDFKLTDIVAGANNDIYILGAEILKDSTFQIYVFKVNENGQRIWANPVIIPIVNDYNNNYSIEKFYFFISENGYALGCFSSNKLFLVVNYQSFSNYQWFYKLIALDEAGSVLMQSRPMQEEDRIIWNYMIEPLPNGDLITSLATGDEANIHQFDSNTFELKDLNNSIKIPHSKINAYLPIFTNMLVLSNEEVIFTGHANKQHGPITGENFDAFLLKYNTVKNTITDTIFFGVKSNYELTFHSFFDADGNVKCIGAKRENDVISHTSESNLYEINFKLNTYITDSIFIIKNKGFEGLYFEPVGDTGLLRILGSKLDISGQKNKQAFFTIIKP